jgi:hypothetical protein
LLAGHLIGNGSDPFKLFVGFLKYGTMIFGGVEIIVPSGIAAGLAAGGRG